MVNINQSENENEELKLSPLGTDEINSVIKSFKNSTFNQEELYKKDKKNFVKKTLFDLAKESERIPPEEIQSQTNNSLETDVLQKQINENEEIIKKPDQKNDLENNHSLNDLEKNSNNKEKEVDQVEQSIDKANEIDEGLKEKINVQDNKLDDASKDNLDKGDMVSDEKIIDTNLAESNKIEYEEKTLEALDSVREAVTKSLEENSESKSEEIKNVTENSKIVSDDINSEINLINTLFKNIREISNNEIENIVKSKVIELAEGVVGYQIEKFPDKFLNKIKKSINEIKSINDDIKIYLNEQDFEFLNKFIDKNETEINFKLDLDSSLGRGDFTIDMGGVIQAIKYKKVID